LAADVAQAEGEASGLVGGSKRSEIVVDQAVHGKRSAERR
jgi:hypothetical protein